MLFSRFRSLRDCAILGGAFSVLIFLGGCGGGNEAQPNLSPTDESMPDQTASVEPEPSAPPGSISENELKIPAESEESAIGDPMAMPLAPLAPLPSVEESTGPDMPVSDVHAMPALPTVRKLDEALPSNPVALPVTPTAEDDPMPQVAQPSLEPKASGPFSENPLREGTDEFPVSPAMTGTPKAPSGVTPTAVIPAKSDSVVAAKPSEGKSSKGKHGGDFDPIAENGPIFVDWQPPKVALLISGRQEGYLEPCGCAGLEKMKGGLTRRHSLFKKLEADGWPVVGVDCGGLVKGFGRQAELKFHLSVDAMQEMGYTAIGLGKSDLRLPAGELLSRVASTPDAPSPFLSANVAVFGFETEMTADHRIVEAGGLRIGITSVLGTTWQKEINNAEVEMADPQTKLRELMPKLKDRCDLLVLLAHATMDESKALAEAFPEFDIVVTGGGDPEPPDREEVLPGGTMLVEVGEKGMNAIVLGIYGREKIVYQRVPLDSRFEDSPDMKAFMRQYQEQLRRDGLAGLGIRQVPHPQAQELGKFVGSKKCMDCHEPSYDVWKKTGHAEAWETLVELEVPRNYDPECISCHVVGWHPTEYFPYESGFLSAEETPRLIDVGCETCHGPGEKHIEAEMGADEELQKKLQKALVVTKEQMRDSKNHWCLNCHDLDNSPDFNFEEYWPKVEHYDYEE